MKAKTIVVVAPPRMSGLDVIIPLMYRYKQICPNSHIYIIFRDLCLREELKKELVLNTAYEKFITEQIFLRGKRKLNVLALFKVLFMLARSNKPTLLHSQDASIGLVGVLTKFTKIRKGKIFCYPKTSAITLGRVPLKKITENSEGDGYLCFNHTEYLYAQKSGRRNIHQIGFPRFYDAWHNHIESLTHSIIPRELPELFVESSSNKPILLLLSSVVSNVFEKEELYEWFTEVVSVIKTIFPSSWILVKPHPMQRQEHLSYLRSLINHEKIIFTKLHCGLLASITRLTISSSSSAILDILIMKKPVILHQKFTKHWLKRHPEKSSYLILGISHSENREQLKHTIKDIEKGHSIPDIRNILRHQENLSVLIEH